MHVCTQNAIREKTQALNYLRLSSRIDAVAARLESAIRMKQVKEKEKRQLHKTCVIQMMIYALLYARIGDVSHVWYCGWYGQSTQRNGCRKGR